VAAHVGDELTGGGKAGVPGQQVEFQRLQQAALEGQQGLRGPGLSRGLAPGQHADLSKHVM
jgi:hypothetical protein